MRWDQPPPPGQHRSPVGEIVGWALMALTAADRANERRTDIGPPFTPEDAHEALSVVVNPTESLTPAAVVRDIEAATQLLLRSVT